MTILSFQIHQKTGLFSEKYATHYDFLAGLEYVISRIKLKATTDTFENGKMQLRCLATIFDIYSLSDGVELLEDTPHVALIMTPLDDANSGKYHKIFIIYIHREIEPDF